MTNEKLDETSRASQTNEAAINPKTGRPAGKVQGTLLLVGSCLPVLGAVLLAPILPILSEEFADAPGAAALVPLILTIPALMIAILAPFAGTIVDKVGRKRVLIWALVAYGILGTMPLWLDTLPTIVLSRVGVGITEAFIMTCCTTLIADYFSGNKRNRYLGLQALVTALAATVFFALGGALGAAGWRTPFWLYSVSIVVAAMMLFAIWPVRQDDDGTERTAAKLEPIEWRSLFLPCGVTLFGGIVFYTLIVELPYVLVSLGTTAPAVIGIATALASLATAIGAFLFRWIAKRGVGILLPLSFLLAGVGILTVGFAPTVPIAIVGAVISGLGTGILLPTLLTWAITRLSYEQRGRGTGLWTSALFFGQFVTPLAVLAFTAALGGLGFALAVIGAFSLLAAVLLRVVLVRNRQPDLVVANSGPS